MKLDYQQRACLTVLMAVMLITQYAAHAESYPGREKVRAKKIL